MEANYMEIVAAPSKEFVHRLFIAGMNAKEVSERYPSLNYNTLRGWYSKFKTVETVETTVSTVSTTVSKTIKTGDAERQFDLEQEEFVLSAETELSKQQNTVSTCFGTNETVFQENKTNTKQQNTVSTCFETNETMFQENKTNAKQQNTVSTCFETDETVFQENKTNTKQEYNKLISICLLALVIVAIKYFSVSEVSFVLKQISSVSGLTTTVFSVVVVVSPLVLLLNATQINSGTLLRIVHFVVVSTVCMQIFCCAVSVSQQIELMQKMRATLANYTFFTPLSFSWTYSVFRGSVDISLEFVLLELMQNLKQQQK